MVFRQVVYRALTVSLFMALSLFMASPASAKTFVVALDSPHWDHTLVRITNPDGKFGIAYAGFGAYADNGFVTAQWVGAESMNRQFGPALETMRALIGGNMPELDHSYAALLEDPAGPLGHAYVQTRKSASVLDKPGQAVYLDGWSKIPFTVSPEQLTRDFSDALSALSESRKPDTGPKSYVVLLEDPDGRVGKVIVNDSRGMQVIEQAGQAVDMDTDKSSLTPFALDSSQFRTDFDEALAARPPLPKRFTVYFKSGKTALHRDSEGTLAEIEAALRGWPAPNVLIEGHADTVGNHGLNDKLSQKRADFVAGRLLSLGLSLPEVEVQAHGKRQPAIPTQDNKKELRNRRVVITIW